MADGGKSKTSASEGPTRHYHGHRERLRQRVLEGDGGHFKDYELLELMLYAFIPRVDTKPIAKELLARFGTVSGVLAAPPERLMEVKGVGETAASYIRAASLLLKHAAADQIADRPVISNWAALLNYVKLALRHEKSEQARVLYLDRKNKLIADEIAGRGTVDHAPIYPREIARRALELSASAVILVHNHPSGDPTPSKADISVTQKIMEASEKLGILLHDHVIIAGHKHLSFRTQGLLG